MRCSRDTRLSTRNHEQMWIGACILLLYNVSAFLYEFPGLGGKAQSAILIFRSHSAMNDGIHSSQLLVARS